MSAPAVRHDLRCAQVGWAGPDVSCTCRDEDGKTRRDGATVVALFSRSDRSCVMCPGPASWQVGPNDRACDNCLPRVLRDAHAAADGFLPPVASPLPGTGGSA